MLTLSDSNFIFSTLFSGILKKGGQISQGLIPIGPFHLQKLSLHTYKSLYCILRDFLL